MATCKISSLFANGADSLEAFKQEFDPYPNGMVLETFREVVLRYKQSQGCVSHYIGRGRSRHVGSGTELVEPPPSAQNTATSPVKNDDSSSTHARNCASAISVFATAERGTLRSRQGNARRHFAPVSALPRRFSSVLDDKSCLEALFNKIDSNGDGVISWDDMLQLAVEEATQSITVMAEEMRMYSFSRVSPRMKLVQKVYTLPTHETMFAVVSRSEPLLLLSKRDFSVVRQFSPNEVGNTHPQIVDYLPIPDVLLAFSAQGKTIRGWSNIGATGRMKTLNPLVQEDAIRRIRTRSIAFPYSFFAGGGHGNVVHWQVPRQRSIFEISRIHSYSALHAQDTGGITDFALTTDLLFSTGFDHRLLSTNLETGRSILIGRPQDTIRFLEYNPNFASLTSVSYTNQIFLWDARSAAVTPGSVFRDNTTRPHTANVIGLCNAPDLPQVITGDCSGLIKVWDLRMLQCTQTLYADGSVRDESTVDSVYGDQASHNDTEVFAFCKIHKSDSRRIHSIGNFRGTQEIVCSSSRAIYCVRYNYRRDGCNADVDAIRFACHDAVQGTIILQGPSRTSVWDASGGFRKRVFDRSVHTNAPYWQHEVFAMCLDSPRSRVFFAVAEGVVEVRSSKNFELLETFSMHKANAQEMLFSARHNLLVSIAVNGTLAVRRDDDIEASDITVVLSNLPLRALTLSDDVGLIGCCDDHNIFLLDFKQTKLYPVVIKIASPVLTMAMLGSYPLLAVGTCDGRLVLWTTLPTEECYTRLASLSVVQALSSTSREETDNKQSFVETSLSGQHCSLPKSACSITPSLPEVEEETVYNGVPELNTACGKSTKGNTSLSGLVSILAADETTNEGLSMISFDEVFHRLFVADQKGHLFIYSLCRLLRKHGFQRCAFEKRTRYSLRGLDKRNKGMYYPVLLNIISVHQCPTNFMAWIPALSAIISCGTDCVVKVLDHDGKETGHLFMDRHPPKSLLLDVDGFDESVFPDKALTKSVNPYALPAPLSASMRCSQCAVLSDGTSGTNSPAPEGPAEETPRLPALDATRAADALTGSEEESPRARSVGVAGAPAETPVVSPTVDLSLPPTDACRLVSLEEKKQWRPRSERPCNFRMREFNPLPSQVSNNAAELPTTVGTMQPKGHLSSAKAVGSIYPWWKPIDLLTTLPTRPWKSSGVALPLSVDDTEDALATAARPPDGLFLLGTSALQPNPPSFKQQETLELYSKSKGLPLDLRGRLRKTQKGKWEIPNLKPCETAAEGVVVEDQCETFLDSMVRSYEKELRRCVRGRGVMERLYKGDGNLNRPTPTKTCRVFKA